MASNSDEDSEYLTSRPKPIFLLIIDGWGVASKSEVNAISLAKTPTLLKLIKEYPAVILEAGQAELNTRYFSLGSGIFLENETDLVPAGDLSASIAAAGLKQLKIFDGERMAALTYFFNGLREERIVGEDWLSISSINEENNFDIYLSLERIFKESLKAVKGGQYDFIVAACSILDFIASSDNFSETIKAAEMLDKYIYRLSNEIIDCGGILLLTSTHGNAERMKNLNTDLPDTEKTNNPVPFIQISRELKGKTIGFNDAPEGDLSLLETSGNLADVTKTIVNLLDVYNEEIGGASVSE